MTAVVMASSSYPVPRRMSAEVNRVVWIAARIAADSAVNANNAILTRATGTPRLRAAAEEPPTPAIQLPKRVRPSRYTPTMAMTIQNRIETWTLVVLPSGFEIVALKPKIWASGSFFSRVGSIGMYVIGLTLDVRTDEKPRMMNSV